mgnify:CR=1 FL=1
MARLYARFARRRVSRIINHCSRRRRRDRHTLREKSSGEERTSPPPAWPVVLHSSTAFRLFLPSSPLLLLLVLFYAHTRLDGDNDFSLLGIVDRTRAVRTSKIPAEREDRARKISREWLIHGARSARRIAVGACNSDVRTIQNNVFEACKFRSISRKFQKSKIQSNSFFLFVLFPWNFKNTILNVSQFSLDGKTKLSTRVCKGCSEFSKIVSPRLETT